MKSSPGMIMESVSTIPLSLYIPPLPVTYTPRALLYRKLSARPLLLCLRLRMGPLLSPIHTSLVAAKTESTPSPMIATAQSNSILSLCVCSLPVYTVCIPEQRKIVWTHLRRKKSKGSRGLKQPECNLIYDTVQSGVKKHRAFCMKSFISSGFVHI